MIRDKEKFWKILRESYDISKIENIQFHEDGYILSGGFGWDLRFDERIDSIQYLQFILNINRVMMLYEDILDLNIINESRVNLRYQLLSENIFILLITSLEVYLVDTFKRLSKLVVIEDLGKENLIKFLKEFKATENFFEKLKEIGNLKIQLNDIIPERLDFQQKEKCKIAYQLLGIDLPNLNHEIWKKIFTKEEHGYIQIRNHIVHGGSKEILLKRRKINFEFLEDSILNVINFVFLIEIDAFSKYRPEFVDD